MFSNFILSLQHELWLFALIMLLLCIKLGSSEIKPAPLLLGINILLGLNFVSGFFFHHSGSLFSEMFISNELKDFQKNILNLGVLLISLQSFVWLKSHQHIIEFYVLLLSSLMGMFFMISAGNILMLYIGLELSTIPLAAAANFNLDKRVSSEAAFKFIISSALSSGVLLLGISFLYGATGTLQLTELSHLIHNTTFLVFTLILIIAGFGFKISAVPFHLWTADVYEGSPVAVTSFLSVISKAAVIFVFTKTLLTAFDPLQSVWPTIISLLALLTIITGNVFAIRQQNIKRLLAFSSIAQVGFILIAISSNTVTGSIATVYFVLIYLFSNLAAFGVVSLISAVTGKENINDYKELRKTNPMLCWVLTIALFSLAGVPPTAGFFGKFFLLMSGAPNNNFAVIVIAALNMMVSMYYYLRVVKIMFMDKNENPVEDIKIPWYSSFALIICVAGIVLTGILSGSYNYIFSIH
ncbi:MAG: NADH-quinone oxidoreductase subunit N [Sphingobacteriia bacterium]|nr:NADH-quinone oxidoreductase subunit N [Sphingobacteriia bacterium]